ASSPARILTVSGNLAFGTVTVGATAVRTLTLGNSGDAPLTVTSISYPTGFSGAWSGTLLPGATVPISVTFAPTAAVAYGGAVTVDANHTSGANTTTASGTGAPAPTITYYHVWG